MSTASSTGELIKLKCRAGNHGKVKEMLRKLLLAPALLRRVETLISRCVWFGPGSGWNSHGTSKIELSLLILRLAYQRENELSTPAQYEIPSLCLGLQIFEVE